MNKWAMLNRSKDKLADPMKKWMKIESLACNVNEDDK
jgi:hypothetical protein